MKNKKILIVEDELIIAENLRFILNEYGYSSVDVSSNVDETKQLFTKNNYDLVLMDINLGDTSEMDGIDLIKCLNQKYTFIYIYITANADSKTIEKAKTTEPSSYIVKPFINSTIHANVEIALNSLSENIYFTYTKIGMQHKILLSEIMYVEADGSYINIFTSNNEEHLARRSIADFLDLYPNEFIRIHKSVLINKNNIQGYSSLAVKVNDKKLPLGRAYKQKFLDQIKDLSFS